MNAFMIFYQEQLSSMKARHPGLGCTELSKLLGNMWRDFDESQKRKYSDLATKVSDLSTKVGLQSKLFSTMIIRITFRL